MPKPTKVNILIVDDKASNIYALEQALAKRERQFIQATSGTEALKIALEKDIDLIILDVLMPDMDGFEVAQILKSNKRTEDIPIIFASAEKKEHKSIMKGYGEGAIDYLYKPLDPNIIEAKVSILIKLHLQKKELIKKNKTLEQYGLLINNSADLICIINVRTLKFEEVNYASKSLLGYNESEMKGSSLLFYLEEQDRHKLEQFKNSTKERFSFETRLYTKKRALKWFQWNIVNKNGLWFANARDVTDIKEVEEIKNYLAILVKQSDDAIYLHNPDGKIISWNEGAEKIYGFAEEEALNMNVENIVPVYLMKEAQNVINDIMNGKRIHSLETKRITKYGNIIDVLFSASVITDTEGKLKSVAITEKDVTQQKKADEEIKKLNAHLRKSVDQLEITNKELESFSYSVSHDLRAPLRAINGYTQIIKEEFKNQLNDELNRLFGIIQNNANKMGSLIDDLLKFSRMGRKEITKTNIDFYELVKHVISEFENTNQHHASINIQSLLPAKGDYKLLYQVMVNLVSNAIKYSSKKPEPKVEIGSYEKWDELIYYVQDNGAGFNMDYYNKLFGVFQRLHSNKAFEGTGVGLATVQRIVVKHGGKVWAESEEDKGATFYFSLPKEEHH